MRRQYEKSLARSFLTALQGGCLLSLKLVALIDETCSIILCVVLWGRRKIMSKKLSKSSSSKSLNHNHTMLGRHRTLFKPSTIRNLYHCKSCFDDRVQYREVLDGTHRSREQHCRAMLEFCKLRINYDN